MKILYKTISGSRLYGLDHADSDYDWFTVVDGRHKTTQTVDKQTGQDNLVVSFGTFVREAQAGSPKALEAMFSQKAEIDLIPAFRSSFVAGTNYDAYKGIMKRISKTDKWDDEKHRRLVMRLGLNLGELRSKNRFNPTLMAGTAKFLYLLAQEQTMEQSYSYALRLAGLDAPVLQ